MPDLFLPQGLLTGYFLNLENSSPNLAMVDSFLLIRSQHSDPAWSSLTSLPVTSLFCFIPGPITTWLPWWLSGEESAMRPGLNTRVRKIPWRRKWKPTPVFLPGESHGQKSLVSYSPWGHKEVDMTEQLPHTHITTWMIFFLCLFLC